MVFHTQRKHPKANPASKSRSPGSLGSQINSGPPVSKIAISKESFQDPAKEGYTAAERVLDSEIAIGEKSSVNHCRSMRARRKGHMSSMRSPLIVNGLNLLHKTFPTFPSFPINFAPD